MAAANHRRVYLPGDTPRVDVAISAAARATSPGDDASQNSPPGSPPVVLFPGVHTIVSYEEAMRYARANGVVARGCGLDLRQVNAHRKQAGLFPFAVKAG